MSNLSKKDIDKIYKKNYNKKCKIYQNEKDFKDVLPEVDRIITIGDLHGDWEETIKCLKVAELIDCEKCESIDDIKWIGGETVLVQVGDQVDRCRELPCSLEMTNDECSDIKILKLFTELHKQAIKVGGAVYSVIGNHELMNVVGRMEYVSYKNFMGFEKDKELDYFMKGKDKIPKNKKNMEAREWLFKPGNPLAEFLACTRKLALKVGSSLFVHAGILPDLANKYPNVGDMNKILALYLFDELENPEEYADILGSDVIKGKTFIGQRGGDVCNGKNCSRISPLWTREFGNINENECSKNLFPVLSKHKVNRMIVGHTPQLNKGINSKCNNSLYFVDYGMSKAFDVADIEVSISGKRSDVRKAQVLEIRNDGKNKNDIKILKDN